MPSMVLKRHSPRPPNNIREWAREWTSIIFLKVFWISNLVPCSPWERTLPPFFLSWRVRFFLESKSSYSLTDLYSCVAVYTRPEDAISFVFIKLRGMGNLSTSLLNVTKSRFSGLAIKFVIPTHH